MNILKECGICGKKFMAHTSLALYCSNACRKKAQYYSNKEYEERKHDALVNGNDITVFRSNGTPHSYVQAVYETRYRAHSNHDKLAEIDAECRRLNISYGEYRRREMLTEREKEKKCGNCAHFRVIFEDCTCANKDAAAYRDDVMYFDSCDKWEEKR